MESAQERRWLHHAREVARRIRRAPPPQPQLSNGRAALARVGRTARKDETMKIISADERLREKSGVKMLIVGPAKIGKTSLLRTVDPARTLFVDLEAGDLAVKDVPVDTLRPQTWEECRNLACFLTGPNPSLPPTACYSEAHYAAIRAEFETMQLDCFDTYFIDSITVAGR